jgi:hypothetical protein
MVQGRRYKGFPKNPPCTNFHYLSLELCLQAIIVMLMVFLWLKEDLAPILYLGLQQQCLSHPICCSTIVSQSSPINMKNETI